jgi:chromate reductase
MHIVVIPGTNREGSNSGRIASLVVAEYQGRGCSVDRLDLALGPAFVDPTAYQAPAPEIKAMVARFCKADGVVFVVPEYNGSFPGVLKLFIDMLPYPAGFDGRPCAYIGIAAGQFQGLRAVEHLQGVSGYRQAHNYPVRLFIGDIRSALTPQGAFANPQLAERLAKQAAGFLRYVDSLKPPATKAADA